MYIKPTSSIFINIRSITPILSWKFFLFLSSKCCRLHKTLLLKVRKYMLICYSLVNSIVVIDAHYRFFRILTTTFQHPPFFSNNGAFHFTCWDSEHFACTGLRKGKFALNNASRYYTITFSRFYVDFTIHYVLAIP